MGWQTVLRGTTLIVLGAVAGAGLAALFFSAAPEYLELAVALGVIAGVAAFVLFMLLRGMLVALALRRLGIGVPVEPSSAPSPASGSGTQEPGTPAGRTSWTDQITGVVAERLRPGDAGLAAALRGAAAQASKQTATGLSAVAALWGAATALGAAVAVVGVVAAVAQVVVGQRQVERLDNQNVLIGQQNVLLERQIYEATATRVSSVFVAQFPDVLRAVSEARPASREEEWIITPDLRARIQATINLAEPYATDPVSDAWFAVLREAYPVQAAPRDPSSERKPFQDGGEIGIYNDGYLSDVLTRTRLYSPERGQLLVLLISLRFPFDKVLPPLDFSGADMRGLRLVPADAGPSPMFSLGQTRLRGANFRDADLSNLDLSLADLQGSVLPRPFLSSLAVYMGPLRGVYGASYPSLIRMAGSDVSFAVVDLSDDASKLAIAEGGISALGQILGGGGTVDPLWSRVNFGDFILLAPSESLRNAVILLADVFGAIGGLEVAQQGCTEADIPGLGAVRKLLNEGADDALRAFIRLRLEQYDSTLLECVSNG